MKTLALSCTCGLAMLALSACGDNSQPVLVDNAAEQNLAEEVDQADLNGVELPPAIIRSPAYRCQDGQALYVDVLSDENAVLVRDSRGDTPTRLERAGGQDPFTGDGRTLSDTDDEVIYASADRPSQVCREAQE